jgi:hypothetical protein
MFVFLSVCCAHKAKITPHFDRSAPLNNMNELTDMKTMEGILLHSKHVLDQALSPGWAGRFSLSSNVMFVNSRIHVQKSHIFHVPSSRFRHS